MRRLFVVLMALLAGCAKVTVTFGNEAKKPQETEVPKASPEAREEESIVVMLNDGVNGTFAGEAKGRNGMVKVEVAMADGFLEKITVLSCEDTPVIADAAIEVIPERIYAQQNAACEIVSGATMTSLAIQEAVKDALSNAGLDPKDYCRETEANNTVKEDEEADIVIVGAGMAGLSAAIESKRSDPEKHVIVIEKNGFTGGSSRVAPGAIWVVNDKINRDLAADPSLSQLCGNLGYDGDMVMANHIYEKSSDVLRYYLEHGLPSSEWNVKIPDTINPIPVFWANNSEPGESGYVDALEKMALDLGVEIRLNTAMVSLRQGDGVEGVAVKDETGSYAILSKKVILACGGFAQNPEMIMKYANMYYKRGFVYAGAGSGDGLSCALACGAKIDGKGMSGSVGVDEIHGNTGKIGSLVFSADLVVNTMGEDFGFGNARKEALLGLVHAQPGSLALGLYKAGRTDLLAAREEGFLKEYATLADVANAYGFDLSKLASLADGAYSVLEIKPMYEGTLAGLSVDSECHVLDDTGSPIKNLYAAGELVKHCLVKEGEGFDGTGLSIAAYTGVIAADSALEDLKE